MKRSPKRKSLLLVLVVATFSIGLVQASRSTADSSPDSISTGGLCDRGKVVARLKDYDPKLDGYGFHNFGGDDHDDENDLDAGDLIKLFGAQNVCQSGNTAQNCVLYEPAEEWLEQQIESKSQGHCDGLAMTSLRFWVGLPWEGKTTPANWQSGAQDVSDLTMSRAVSSYVSYFHILQDLDEVHEFREEQFKKKPSEILKTIIDSMKDNAPDHFELAIYQLVDGEHTKGHAILPYAVEDMGEGLYHIHVYDSNYEKESKYVELDVEDETWRYHTASDPGETAEDYVGNATTKSLSLQNLNARELEQYGCPFCPESNERAALHHTSSKKPRKDQVGFMMSGEGKYLITDPNGKRIGYDFARSRFVNEIPEANVVAYTGGLGKNIPPQFHLPRLQSTRPYTITVAGKGINKEVDADIEMTGPGFIVGFEYVLLDPGETMSMTISPNGRELSFTATQDGETPNVFMTIATGPKAPSYEFEIGGIKLAAGKTVTMKLDLEKQKLYFKDNDPDRDPYDVFVTRVNPNGTEDYYENQDLDLAKKADNFEMDFGKWDGKGEMCFEEDDENNGFQDEECDEEPNETKKKPAQPAKPAAAVNYFAPNHPIARLLWY